jgi:hypothetical protein
MCILAILKIAMGCYKTSGEGVTTVFQVAEPTISDHFSVGGSPGSGIMLSESEPSSGIILSESEPGCGIMLSESETGSGIR